MRYRERGQTLPLWVLGIAAMCALMFFTANYANMIRWQIRAQNAADSAASAGIATDANAANQSSMLVYAASIEEVRMRYLLQAMVNLVYDAGACSGSACDADLRQLETAYTTASNNYTGLINQMHAADTISSTGLKNGAANAAALVAANCSTLDCAFTYTTTIDTVNEVVDVTACKSVPTLVPAIMGLASSSAFKAVGRSAMTLGQVRETFVPSATNPTTGQPFQSTEKPAGSNTSNDLAVVWSGVTMQIPWYYAVPARPKALSAGYGCS